MESVSYGETPIAKAEEKFCADCNTSKTPLWRSGPAGPKSLCNACGIRYRKKKSTSGSDKKKPPVSSPIPTQTTSSSSSSSSCSIRIGEDDKNSDLRKKLRIKLVALGKEVVLLQRQRSGMKKKKKVRRRNDYEKLGEVEQAAFLLMSLSCGSPVFA